MKGQYIIEVYDRAVYYKLAISRNITILKGNSGTGKTTLYNLIDKFSTLENSGVKLKCDIDVVTLSGRKWKETLEIINNSIVFIDEGNSWIFSNDFAETIQHSNNYFVLITRHPLPKLAYSITEVYELIVNNNKEIINRTYNMTDRFYKNKSKQ